MTTSWNAASYDTHNAFVWQFGAGVVDLLAPQPGETIIDLGCGTGHLTAQIAQAGAHVMGLDASPEMVAQARRNYPDLRFQVADARDFQVDAPVDAVFSNATLHWVRPPEPAIACIYRALKPGGRFVAELGGKGNIETLVSTLYASLRAVGYATPEKLNPWYFPSLGEYARLLEQAEFRVAFAAHFDRPTQLDNGAGGMRQWLEMFAGPFLDVVPGERRDEVIERVERAVQRRLWRDGVWTVDYKRLRIVAVKEGS